MKLSDFARRADEIITLGQTASATSGRTPWGGTHLSEDLFMEFRAAALSFLRNVFGTEHPYYTTFDTSAANAVEYGAQAGLGVMAAAKNEVLGGWTQTATGIVSAEIFSDFIDMAEHLLAAGYKDAAAVLVGGVLEEHLRQLCRKHNISLVQGEPGNERSKAADLLNSDLAGHTVYAKLDLKAVTAWLDLRNKAAHGRYSEYTREQVDLVLQGVRNFIVRNPI